MAALGDPTTYKPSIVGAYALQNEGTVGPSGYPAITQIDVIPPEEEAVEYTSSGLAGGNIYEELPISAL